LPESSLAAERDRLAAAVREAGAMAMRTFRGELKSWTKGASSSPVSEADIAVDALLRERLSAIRAAGWLSEETEDDPARLAADRVWIVDPIDGTRAFLANRDDWCVSVALAERGRPVVAAIYAPSTDDLFLASAGGGATHNGRPMSATDGTSLAGARVAGPDRRLARLASFGIVAELKVHALALRVSRVAQGRLDIALAGPNSSDWDLAAADLLVHEAGGVLTTLAGETLVYNRPKPKHSALFAAGRARHQVLSDLMREGRVAFP
jgi:myo-inositol-1(or 4)-monophosphatase